MACVFPLTLIFKNPYNLCFSWVEPSLSSGPSLLWHKSCIKEVCLILPSAIFASWIVSKRLALASENRSIFRRMCRHSHVVAWWETSAGDGRNQQSSRDKERGNSKRGLFCLVCYYRDHVSQFCCHYHCGDGKWLLSDHSGLESCGVN